jgi:hypothetical protein
MEHGIIYAWIDYDVYMPCNLEGKIQDNQQQILEQHSCTYVFEACKWALILLFLERVVHKSNLDNLIKVVVNALTWYGGLFKSNVTLKLTCFGVNGAINF